MPDIASLKPGVWAARPKPDAKNISFHFDEAGGRAPCGAIGCANTRLPPTGALPRTPPKGLSPFGIPQSGQFLWGSRNDDADEESAPMHKEVFCRDLDAISRKQGMKGGSVLAHVTDWNDDADEESAPKREQKKSGLKKPH